MEMNFLIQDHEAPIRGKKQGKLTKWFALSPIARDKPAKAVNKKIHFARNRREIEHYGPSKEAHGISFAI
jgi:hypothetical protein